MNKKLKLRRIKWGIFILLCFVASGLTYSAYATQVAKVNNTQKDTAEQTSESNCNKNTTCKKAPIVTLYNPEITNKYNEKTKEQDISIKINKTDTKSKFYYVVAKINIDNTDDGISTDGYSILWDGYLTNTNNEVNRQIAANKEAEIRVILALEESESPKANCTSDVLIYPHDSIKVAIDKYLKNQDSENPVVDKIDDKKCRYALFLTRTILIDEYLESSETNESLTAGGLCYKFVSGQCDFDGSKDGIDSAVAASLKSDCNKYNPTVNDDLKNDNNIAVPKGYLSLTDYYSKVIPYCYSDKVDTNYNNKDIASMISNAMSTYIVDTADYSENGVDGEAKANKDGYITVKKPTNVTTLTCDKNNVSDTYANIGDKYEFKNTAQYYHSNTTTTKKSSGKNEYTCTKTCEEKVTVEYGPPVAVKAGLCFEYQVKITSTVKCNSKFEGSKPNKDDKAYKYCTPTPYCNKSTEFYDQAGPNDDFDSCINNCDDGKYTQSCIDQCYDEVYSSESILGVNYTNQVTVQQISNALLNKKENYKGATETQIKELMKAVKNNSNCFYKRDDKTNQIIWTCKEGHEAVGWEKYGRYYFQTLSKAKETVAEDKDSATKGEYRIKNGKVTFYFYDGVDGFKKACTNGREKCSTYCQDDCVWVGCTDAENLNPTDAITKYNADLEAYNAIKKECTSSVSCSTTQTTITIKVDNTTKDGKISDTFKASSVKDAPKTWEDDQKIIIDKGACYASDSEKTKEYMLKWSVPGTWINNKTGEISYETKNEKNGWTKKENQFCTSLQSTPVNEKWWNWRISSDTSEAPDPEDDDNIIATARNFGHFDWAFDIKCFYALSDSSTTCLNPPCDTLEEPEEPLSYRIRSVDSTNLFPSSDEESKSRESGFNWSNLATNLDNSSYEITPGALAERIQNLGSSIYSASYLDYEFYLDMKALQKLASSKENFNSFSNGETIEDNGMTFYKSHMIRDNGIINNITQIPSVLGCNNRYNATSCEKISDNDYVTLLRDKLKKGVK